MQVNRTHPRNNDGDWFSVLVTRTVAQSRPSSDEISRAFEEGWVGRDGYVRADGTRQPSALAFQGLVTAADGSKHAEVFLVDLPEDLTHAGSAPLEGTATTRPAAPRGVHQRRLTFTGERKFPGVVTTSRHWLRVSPDGSQIAFLMKDDRGIVQFWTISPNGGEPHQVTHGASGISSAFTWSPNGHDLAHLMDGSVCITNVATGRKHRLTLPTVDSKPSPLACVFSPEGRSIAYMRQVAAKDGTAFEQIFVVDVPQSEETDGSRGFPASPRSSAFQPMAPIAGATATSRWCLFIFVIIARATLPRPSLCAGRRNGR